MPDPAVGAEREGAAQSLPYANFVDSSQADWRVARLQFAERSAGRMPPAAFDLFTSRRNRSLRKLHSPGPTPEEMNALFVAAAAAPDHGRLTPWRFVVVPTAARARLGEAFAMALCDRDPGATTAQIEEARGKADRSPFLALAILREMADVSGIPAAERIVSLGCAIQNILLCAHLMAYSTGLASGRALHSDRIRALFRLSAAEQPICFIGIGTASEGPSPRQRPDPGRFVSEL